MPSEKSARVVVLVKACHMARSRPRKKSIQSKTQAKPKTGVNMPHQARIDARLGVGQTASTNHRYSKTHIRYTFFHEAEGPLLHHHSHDHDHNHDHKQHNDPVVVLPCTTLHYTIQTELKKYLTPGPPYRPSWHARYEDPRVPICSIDKL